MVEGPRTPVLALGIGNLLWADEGFGVRCAELLHHRWELPPGVELLDGGTQGLYLVNPIAAADHLLVFDALDYGDPPGTLKVVRNADVPRFFGVKKMSLHQTSFQEVLAATELMGSAPRQITLIGVQVQSIDEFGAGLTPEVAAQLDKALIVGVAQLTAWGYGPKLRSRPAAEPLLGPGLSRADFEAQRPSAESVCREGDPRFLKLRAGRG